MRVLLAILVTVAGLVAQQPQAERRPMLGRVLDQDGAPAAGAEVTLVGAVGVFQAQCVPADVVTVRTDERGRFRTDLLPLALYTAWAAGPPDENGARAVSEAAANVGVGPPIELRLGAPERHVITVTGLEPWADLGPFRLRLQLPFAVIHDVECPIGAEGEAVLPPLPQTGLDLLLLTADGQPLAHRYTTVQGQQFALPPPRELPVRAVDAAGKPVAGVAVDLRIAMIYSRQRDFAVAARTPFRRVGVTGADGTATVRVPLDQDPFESNPRECLLIGSKAGFGDSVSGWSGRRYEDGLRWEMRPGAEGESAEKPGEKPGEKPAEAQPARDEIVFRMGEEQQLTATLVRHGQPVAGQRVQVAWIDKLRNNAQGNSWTHLPRSAEVRSDAEGKVVLPGLRGDSYDFTVTVPVSPTRVFVPAIRAGREVGTIDLAEPRLLSLQVLDTMAGPGHDVVCLLQPIDTNSNRINEGRLQFRVDAAGRAELPVPTGAWLLLAMDARGFAHVSLAEVQGERLEVRLEELPVMRLRIVDEEGKPVAGASLQIAGTSTRGVANPLERALDTLAMSMSQNQVGAPRSDADGQMEVRFLQRDRVRLQVRARQGSRSSPTVELRAEPERVELALTGGK